MAFCTNCGTKLGSEGFCSNCGAAAESGRTLPEAASFSMRCDLCAEFLRGEGEIVSPEEMRIIAGNGYGKHLPFGQELSVSQRSQQLYQLALMNETDWLVCNRCYQATRESAVDEGGMSHEMFRDQVFKPLMDAMEGRATPGTPEAEFASALAALHGDPSGVTREAGTTAMAARGEGEEELSAAAIAWVPCLILMSTLLLTTGEWSGKTCAGIFFGLAALLGVTAAMFHKSGGTLVVWTLLVLGVIGYRGMVGYEHRQQVSELSQAGVLVNWTLFAADRWEDDMNGFLRTACFFFGHPDSVHIEGVAEFDKALPHVENLTSVEQVFLRGEDLEDQHLELLPVLPFLRSIYIHGRTRLTADGIQRLKDRVPGVEVDEE